MIKELAIALSLVAAPLAMSPAFAQGDTHQDSADMHKDGKMAAHHRDAHRHGMTRAQDRASLDRQEAKVTSDLNRRELGDNSGMNGH